MAFKINGTTVLDTLGDPSSSTAFGNLALANDDNTTNNNTAFGVCALNAVTSGIHNVAVGLQALDASNGNSNVAIGYQAGLCSTGNCNTFVGNRAGDGVSTPNYNTGIGALALNGTGIVALTGVGNTAVGGLSGAFVNGTAECNTMIGVQSGQCITGNNNVFIGACSGTTFTSGSNTIVIGHNAQPTSDTVSNEITIGDANITRLRIPGLSYDTDDGPIGHANVPPVGTKTASYTLAVADVGKYVQVGAGGSITIPDATFAEGDIVSIFNNTTGDITITCSITTAYIAGTDTDKATVTLATRGVATILFISGTLCVISGNVS